MKVYICHQEETFRRDAMTVTRLATETIRENGSVSTQATTKPLLVNVSCARRNASLFGIMTELAVPFVPDKTVRTSVGNVGEG